MYPYLRDFTRFRALFLWVLPSWLLEKEKKRQMALVVTMSFAVGFSGLTP